MCGIAGIISKSHSVIPEHSKLVQLAASIRHRGPDAEGIAMFPGRGFINRRLAIVDIVGGEQPIYNEDGSIGIVYNGEVYNYLELRRILEQHGHTFKTHTDTEVIVHLFEQFGEQAFGRLRGMFAFALWSPNAVYIVRDHLGIKPLYFYEDGERLVFSSEVKGLRALDGISWELDPFGIADYLTFRYVRAPRTVFKHIRKLPPGSFLRVQNGRTVQIQYWQPVIRPKRISSAAAIEELRERLNRSVASQLIGERPIGLLLSGGLDSSTIAYALHEAGVTVKTFNIGFHNVNEFSYSDAVARKFQLPHWMLVLDESRMAEYVGHYLRAIDEPIADAACVPLYRLCEEIKSHVTVVLSGEGSDELFAGYPQYSAITQRFSKPSTPAFEAFLDESYYFRDGQQFLTRAVPLDLWEDGVFGNDSLLNGMLAYDFRTWIPDDLMMKADKILMAHSLEGRFPFLDVDLMEFSFSLPCEYKLGPGNIGKWILREAMRDRLPRECLTRPKMGFTVPIEQVLQQCRESALELVSSSAILDEVLNRKKIKTFMQEYYCGKHKQTLQTWVLYVLCRWFHEWNSCESISISPPIREVMNKIDCTAAY